MKKYYLMSAVILSLALTAKSEIEPNNTYLTANTLAPNGSDVGSLTTSTDNLDWWKVTTTADGKLTVTTESSAALIISLAMYDINGTTYIAGNDLPNGTTQVTHFNNLLPGTSYYIEVNNYNGATGTYTITSVFTPAALTVDPMNNDVVAGAVTLTLNGSSTGHIGYTDTGYVDLHDWWKVTVPQDGQLIVRTTSDTTAEIDLEMYDANGTTMIAVYDTSWGIHEATHYSHLMPGTYYIDCYLPSAGYGYGSYTITSIFTPANYSPDPLNNDSMQAATPLGVNTSSTGHIGYYTLGYTDLHDWYSVTVPQDGQLIVRTTSDSSAEIDLEMYDVNGTTMIAVYDTSWGIHEATHYNNLMPGTYFIDCYLPSVSYGYGAYTITTIFNPAAMPNDAENNDVSGNAVPLTFNDSLHGHLGYYTNGYTDLMDWYKVTIPSSLDSFVVETISDSTLEVDFDIYAASDLVNPIISGTAWGILERVKISLPAGGQYYIRARRYSGYGAYNIKNNGYGLTSVNEIAGQTFSIYPNPVRDIIHWSKGNQSGEYQVTLMNDLGEVMLSQWATDKTGSLDISSLAAGMYCIQFKENGTVVKSKMIVKE